MSSPFFESFDNGVGALTHRWGSGIDTSVRGQVTVSGDSGMMEQPWGAAAGHGYGTYTVVAKLNGYDAGPAALLWPGNDKWPGPEMDIVEFINGHAYSALHWDNGGRDGYRVIEYSGLDAGQTHTYTLDWQPGRVTVAVDGRTYGSYTDNVSADYDHGGVNQTMSIMNRGWNTSITVYEIGYSPNGGGGSVTRSETPEETTRQDTPTASVSVSAPAAVDIISAPASGGDRPVIHVRLDTIGVGHVVDNFQQGETLLSLDGYGAGARIDNLGGGTFRITAENWAWDEIRLPGVSDLKSSDYILT
ncbi:family 16 glycosylhydrolase [Paracraurococcus ruber]|uniref:family 16 glycosylhydrolase n=1 Tax=Paracraurococcus ruber TaxID=77675 RepID=UPI0013053958|nr:family 16 glycosylhydrolase [Paracraurococcus ruber]